MGNRKLSNSLSKSEFIMICTFFFVAVGVFMLTYLLLPAWNRCKETMEQYRLHEQQLNELKSEYLSINDYKSEAAAISGELERLRSNIPCYLSHEETVLLLDFVSAETDLSLLDIFFAGEVCQDQVSFLSDLTQTPYGIGDSSQLNGELIASERITIKFLGTYDSLIAFLHFFEQNTEHICFRDISLSGDESGFLSGTMTLLVFSFVKSNLPFWTDPNTFHAPESEGKSDPFARFDSYLATDESDPLTVTPFIN